MRLTLFLCLAIGTPLSAQQIGSTDPLIASAVPIEFCVNMDPQPTADQPDLWDWTFPSGSPNTVEIAADRVLALPGTAFGFALRATGPDRLEDVTVVVDHPALNDSGETRQSWSTSLPAHTNALSFYGFGREKEVTPGRWEFTYLKDDRVIYRHVLTLVPDKNGAFAGRTCAAAFENNDG